MTLNNKNEKNDWGNVHGLILFLGIKDVFDDFKQQKRKKKDWSKCLGLPVTGYGPAFRCEDLLWILTLFSFHGHSTQWFSNCLLNTDHVTVARKRSAEIQCMIEFLVIVIPREVKKERTQKIHKFGILSSIYTLSTKVKTFSNIKLLLYIQT